MARRPTSPKRHWTDEDDRRLIELRKAGLGVKKIVVELGRSRNGVEQRITHLFRVGAEGMERREIQVFTEEHDRIILEMFASGSTYRCIADVAGLKPDQVKGRVKLLRERGHLALARNLETADIQAEIHSRKVQADAEIAIRAESLARIAAEDAKESLRREVVRCRELSRKHGWSPMPNHARPGG